METTEETDDGKLITTPPTPEEEAHVASLALDGPFTTLLTIFLLRDANPDAEEEDDRAEAVATVVMAMNPGTLPGTLHFLEALDEAVRQAPKGFRIPTRHEYLRIALGVAANVAIPGPADFTLDNTVSRA